MAKAAVWQNGLKREFNVEAGTLVADMLIQNGVSLIRPCGGRGVCGKCAVALSGSVSPESEAEKRLGTRLACQARILGDASIFLSDNGAISQIETGAGKTYLPLDPMPGLLGAAVDIGTTTVAVKLYELKTGAYIATSARINPQTSVAADVMGRIGFAMSGGLKTLQSQILSAIDSLIGEACGTCGRKTCEVESMVVTGNTTMLYLLTARDPERLSHAPFNADCLFDETKSVLGRQCYLPACMNAFVGADITCALLASGACDTDETSLLCDIGTNGEIALWRGGELFVTSTAAGPAFEGAGISCGVGSVPGAIDKVSVVNDNVYAATIGNKKAVGVCGSGLVDAVAAFLKLGWIDETGATDCDYLPIKDTISLKPSDIRAVQLAKAAIAAGIETLRQQSSVALTDVKRVYIAGGFGSHLNISSAAEIGLIPRGLASRVTVVGNAALDGAAMMLLNKNEIVRAREIACLSRHVNLGGNPLFNENYMEQMMFGEE